MNSISIRTHKELCEGHTKEWQSAVFANLGEFGKVRGNLPKLRGYAFWGAKEYTCHIGGRRMVGGLRCECKPAKSLV